VEIPDYMEKEQEEIVNDWEDSYSNEDSSARVTL
jgi:hypothetical protein